MAETTDQILGEIASQRKCLGESISDLESYVREKTDVRAYYERNPWAFLGGAAFGGILLARMIFGGLTRRG
jgi:hypothetical protein